MIMIFGTKLYGKVDEVPGLFYVSTQFFHLNYLPLVPVKSHLVMAGTEKGENFTGVPIPMSWKSLIFAYVRAILFVLILATLMVALVAGIEQKNDMVPALVGLGVIFTLLAGLFWGSYFFTRAGPLKALKLAGLAGIQPEIVAQFFAHTLTPQELERLAELNRSTTEEK